LKQIALWSDGVCDVTDELSERNRLEHFTLTFTRPPYEHGRLGVRLGIRQVVQILRFNDEHERRFDREQFIREIDGIEDGETKNEEPTEEKRLDAKQVCAKRHRITFETSKPTSELGGLGAAMRNANNPTGLVSSRAKYGRSGALDRPHPALL
jgi:hypothetical protein